MNHDCHCGERFDTEQALRQHRQAKHGDRQRLPSWLRPRQRGDIRCGNPGCEATFGNEADAKQHRRAKHGVSNE